MLATLPVLVRVLLQGREGACMDFMISAELFYALIKPKMDDKGHNRFFGFTRAGVRWYEEADNMPQLSPRDMQNAFSCSEAGRLDFPALASAVVRWYDFASSFVECDLPEFLREAVNAPDVPTTRKTLRLAVEKATADMAAKADAYTNTPDTHAVTKFVAKQARDDAHAFWGAVERCREAFQQGLESPRVTEHSSPLRSGVGVVISIQGRDAIPVRAIPLITDWALTPDRWADLLYDETDVWPDNRDNSGKKRAPWLTAHRLLSDREVREVAPREWRQVVAAIDGFDSRLNATEHDQADGYSQWQRDAMGYFPKGFFVWRDEFEARVLNPNADKVFWPDEDWTPNYTPMFLGDARAMVMAGFEQPITQASRSEAGQAWSPYIARKGAKALQVLVVAAVNDLKLELEDLPSQNVVDWIVCSKSKQARQTKDGNGYEYFNGAGWNPLTTEVVGKQLRNISRSPQT